MGPVLVGFLAYGSCSAGRAILSARGMVANIVPILIFAALGYGFSYLTVRGELKWVVSHSMDRLEMQLWPSILLVLFMHVGSPTERSPLRHAGRRRWIAKPARGEPAAAARRARPGSERAPPQRRLAR